MNYLVSVIIPCFNTGEFLYEAIQSVFNSEFDQFEIVIVNDGSDDLKTLNIFNTINFPRTKVVHQKNKGLGAARNFGVKYSSGDILFFLDSDNRVRKSYFEKALLCFEKNKALGVVYAKPFFFGELIFPRFESRDFNFDALLAGNYIDACAFVRKKAFDDISGFDENRNLKISEDWEFWIRLAETSWEFHFLNEQLFDYRIRRNSMIGENDHKKIDLTLNYIGNKHGFLIHQRYRQYFRIMEKIQDKPFFFFLRILYYKYVLRKPLIK